MDLPLFFKIFQVYLKKYKTKINNKNFLAYFKNIGKIWIEFRKIAIFEAFLNWILPLRLEFE
nr:hypothetical protein [uncultured Campylobacter sp.]